MNQSFDLSRWWLLVAKHWSENSKKYILSLIAIGGLLLLWFVFVILTDAHRPMHENLQAISYFFGLFIFGCLYASMLFSELASRSKGINYLSVPASHLEKLLCAFFYGVVLLFVCYTTIFYLVDIIMVKVSNAIEYSRWAEQHTARDKFVPEKLLNIFATPNMSPNEPNLYAYLLLGYVALQSAFMMGSVYFPKFSFIKTVIALLLLTLFFFFFVGKVLPLILPDGRYYNNMTSFYFYENGKDSKIVMLPEWINNVLAFLVKYAVAPLLWTVTYFRLKEKEI